MMPPLTIKNSIESFIIHWRLLFSLILGTIVGLTLFILGYLPPSTCFIIGWDCAILCYIVNIIIMLNNDTMHYHINRAKQSQFTFLFLIVLSSFICVYALTEQTAISKDYEHVALILSIGLTIGTIFTTWLMIQIIFAMHYAFLYFSELQKGGVLPLAFPEMLTATEAHPHPPTSPKFEDFFYCAVSIGTSGQTADTNFVSTAGRKLATLHNIIAFTFNLVIIALMINILATYL